MAGGYSVTFSVVDDATKKIEDINRKIRQMREPIERQSRAFKVLVDQTGLKQLTAGLQDVARGALESYDSLGRLLPLFGALTGPAIIAGLTRLTNSFADWSRTLENTADLAGTTAEQMQVMQNAARLVGGNADDMTKSLVGVEHTLHQIATGEAPAAALAYRRAGISFRDSVTGQRRHAAEVIPDIVKYLGTLRSAQDREAEATRLGARELYDFTEDLKHSGVPLDEAIKRAQRMGVVNEKQRKSFTRYREAVGELDIAFTNFGAAVASKVAPVLVPLLRFMSDHLDEIATIGGTIATLFITKWGITSVKSIAATARAVLGLNTALEATAAAEGVAEAAAAPLFAAYAPLAAIVAAVWSLAEAWKAVKARQSGEWKPPEVVPGQGVKTYPVGPPGTYNAGPPTAPGGYAPIPPPAAPTTAPTPAAPTAPGGAAAPTGTYTVPQGAIGGAGAGGTPPGMGYSRPTVPGAPGAPAAPGAAIPPPSGAYAPGPAPPGSLFAQRAPELTTDLMQKLNLTREQASGLVGNLGYESGGFESLQEKNPRAGGAGGYGYAQWTGPRRAAFFAYAQEHNLDPRSHAANVGFLTQEIQQKYPRYLADLRRTKTIAEAAHVTNAEYEVSSGALSGKFPTDPERTAYGRQAFAMSEPAAGGRGGRGDMGGSMVASIPPPGRGATGSGGRAAQGVNEMVALAGTRGAAVRQFLKDPSGVVQRDPDLGLWCAEFTNAYLQHIGVTGTKWGGPNSKANLLARSFANWGDVIDKNALKEGDVLLNLNRKHVGVATGRTWLNTPGHRRGEVEEVSSNSIVNGRVVNIPGTRWRSDVEVRRSQELAIAEQEGRTSTGTMLAGGPNTGSAEADRGVEAVMAMRRRRAAAMQVDTGRGINGSVDINVTHRNPPAGSSVTAAGKGNGVRVGQPRIEQQDMASI